MPVQEITRDYLPTLVPSAEISTPQILIEMVPGLGEDSVLTEETGFPLWMEINRLFNDLNFALSKGKNLTEALTIATNELVVNIRDYDVEFIKSKTIIPHSNRFDVADGVTRLVGNNGRPVIDAISSRERNGSVLEAAKTAELFLLSAEPNSYVVTMSPSGWSGYELRHKNAQTMVSWKDQEGVSKGLTFVTDLSEEQAREVMISLGVSEEVLTGESEQERVANIVKNPALLSFPGSNITPFEYVFDKILAARGRENIKLLQKDNSVEIRKVEQTRADIKRFEELLVFDQEEELCIAELQDFIMERAYLMGDRSTQERIVKEIEDTILKLAGVHLRRNDTTWRYIPDDYKERVIQYNSVQDIDNFRPELAFLKSRGGCPTGGLSAGRALGGVSLGSAISGGGFLESDSMGSLKFPCPACGWINERPREGYVELCQNPNCPSPTAVACGSAGKEEGQEEDSNIIAFSSKTSSQPSAPVELAKAA